MAKNAKAQTVAAFYVPCGVIVGKARFSEARYIAYKGDSSQLCQALSVKGVIETYRPEDNRIAVDVQDTNVVHCYVNPTGGLVVTTTCERLIDQLNSLPNGIARTTETNRVALKALGIETQVTDLTPAEPISVILHRSSGAVFTEAGLKATLDTKTQSFMEAIGKAGAVNYWNGIIKGRESRGCQTWLTVNLDGMVVLTTNHPAVVQALKANGGLFWEMSVIFPGHRGHYAQQLRAIEVEAAYKLHKAELERMAAAGPKPVHVLPTKVDDVTLADAMTAEVAEASAKPKPARKSRARVTEQATVTA